MGPVFLHKVRPANYFHSSGERWGVLLPSSTLQVWGSIQFLIRTSATSFLVSSDPPLRKQTCHNWCVQLVAGYRHSLFTRTKCSTFLIDITRTTTWRSPRELHTWLHTWAGHGMEPVGIPGVQSTNYWLTGNSPDQANQSVNYKGSYLDPGGLGAV